MKSAILKISIHLLAWTLLLMVPFFSTFQVIESFNTHTELQNFTPIVVLSLLLISIFYINYYLLIPKFLLTKKYVLYGISLFATLFATFIISGFIFHVFQIDPHYIEINNPLFAKISPIAKANAFLMLLITLLASIVISIHNKLRKTEEEKLSAQISSLKSQINPHFLFNVLNSIYATSIESSPQTADMIQRLSEMMRYAMKDTQKDFVPLDQEINYITNYIELQKVRLDSNIDFEYSNSIENTHLQIAPMLLIPFIENAFKYGVNSEEKSKIQIKIQLEEEMFYFFVANNKVHVQTKNIESNGLGIENVTHRLQLIYASKHILTIKNTDTEFSVLLQINLG